MSFVFAAPLVPFTVIPIASAYAAASLLFASLIETPAISLFMAVVTVVLSVSVGVTLDGLILK